MAPHIIIYGATGYTGRLAAAQAKSKGLPSEVAGRNRDKVAELASALGGVPYRVFDAAAPESVIDAALALGGEDDSTRGVLLNCAGPFARTAAPLMRACVRTRTHYLDVSADLDTYALAGALDAEARGAGVTLLPGCGGSVAMLGCLASYAAAGEEKPASVDVALHVAGSMSRGSAESVKTTTGGGGGGPLQRVDGRLVEVKGGGGDSRFDFGDGRGAVACFPATLPDLVTIPKATGAENVRTFVNASGGAFPSGDVSALPDGPSLREREANPYHASVRVTAGDGTVRRAVLHTVNGYVFTAVVSVEGARRTLSGEFQAGFATSAAVFGNRFIEDAVDGTKIVEL